VEKKNVVEPATLPAKTAGATAAGISSYGVAIAFGLAAIAMIAALSGGFKTGGYTGDGDPNAYAGPAHKGEYYFTADDVRRIGIPKIEALRFGRSDAATSMASSPAFTSPAAEDSGGGGGGRPINMHVLFDQADVRRALQNEDGEAWVVDVMQRNRWRMDS
jgi:hypothetical protein